MGVPLFLLSALALRLDPAALQLGFVLGAALDEPGVMRDLPVAILRLTRHDERHDDLGEPVFEPAVRVIGPEATPASGNLDSISSLRTSTGPDLVFHSP